MWEFVYDTLTHGGNLDPIWVQKMFLGLIFQEFCDFWDLGLTLMIIRKDAVYAEILGFSNIFWFSGSKLGPKMDRNCKL